MRAIKTLEVWSYALSPQEIVVELGKLRLCTTAKDLTQDDLGIQISIYTEKLMSYPAEAVKYVLTTQADVSKWWPAWSDIYVRLELHCAKRRKTLEALKNYAPQETEQKDPGKNWQTMTVDEKAIHRKMMAEITGAAESCEP